MIEKCTNPKVNKIINDLSTKAYESCLSAINDNLEELPDGDTTHIVICNSVMITAAKLIIDLVQKTSSKKNQFQALTQYIDALKMNCETFLNAMEDNGM